jgi:hypothetical protein
MRIERPDIIKLFEMTGFLLSTLFILVVIIK